MKIGENKPVSPGDAVRTEREPKAGAPAEESFAERLSSGAPGETQGASGSQGTAEPAGFDPGVDRDLVALADRVDRGEITAEEAVTAIVQRVVDAQLPEGSPPELRAQVFELVEASLHSDPLLGSLVQRLGGGGS